MNFKKIDSSLLKTFGLACVSLYLLGGCGNVEQKETSGLSAIESGGIVESHNTLRARHGAAPLTWSSTLQQSAQRWASTCPVPGPNAHSHSGYGENIYFSSASPSSSEVVNSWYGERAVYERFSNNYRTNYPTTSAQFDTDNSVVSTMYGHFTQVVWKGSTQVGCAEMYCRGAQYPYVVVCQYSPRGNMVGSFQQNVGAPGGTSTGKPDLVVPSISLGAPSGKKVPITVTVKNQGSAAASKFKIGAEYLDSTGRSHTVAFTQPGPVYVYYPWINSLGVGNSVVVSGTLDFLPIATGTVRVRVLADSCSEDEFMPAYCRQNESSETNNYSGYMAVTLR
ncbi:MAG: hypothetical protein HQK54_11665 [Oligoflexales bacterium]|nr:hypothetical protein [Oligoflexales bacterium]